jgi:hypothetical protein
MKIYKNLYLKIVVISCILLFSCDEGFEEMNKNPNAYVEPTIGSLFSYNISESVSSWGRTLYSHGKLVGCYVQVFSSLNTTQWPGDKYFSPRYYEDELFNSTYSTMKETAQLIHLTKDNPDLLNHHNIVRIWRVWVMHDVTDVYGDVPYFDAGKGYIDGVLKPRYDPQSEIYADMLKELDEAAGALNPSLPSFGSADFLYNGNTEQWKRFAYSMMLRLGMRLTKVDPAMAETWVKKAIAGGVMQSNADVARLPHTDEGSLNFNKFSREMWRGEGCPPAARGKGYAKMGETFVSHLVNTNDPRIPFYMALWQGNANPDLLPEYTDPDLQKGLPHGYDYSSIRDLIPDWNEDMQADYSEPNLHSICSPSAPTIFQSYAEVKLLLAEAALRGWGPGNAKTHYEDAVRASMQMPLLFPGNFSISAEQVNGYLEGNPYVEGTFDQQMEQIHTQFWVSLIVDNLEIWANWRRTGYPVLTPTNYPGNATGGQIPRRIKYLNQEASVNTENYNEAVQRQGPDDYLTRVWWDVN